jgi:hypothetical protein
MRAPRAGPHTGASPKVAEPCVSTASEGGSRVPYLENLTSGGPGTAGPGRRRHQ